MFLSGCSGGPNYLVNLDYVKEAIIKYHESGSYDKDIKQSVSEAIDKFEDITPEEKSAVVFDVDETAISNYSFIKAWDFAYVAKYFDMWIDSAKAPAVPGVLQFYNYLLERNLKIIFLTGRRPEQYDATYRNLKEAGYTVFDTIIVRGNEYHGISTLKFKSDKREELTQKGYIIAGTVGDQWSDLEGPYHGIQVKIPNYQYFIR